MGARHARTAEQRSLVTPSLETIMATRVTGKLSVSAGEHLSFDGRQVSEGYVTKLQQLLLSMQRHDELSGRQSEGFQLAVALAERRR